MTPTAWKIFNHVFACVSPVISIIIFWFLHNLRYVYVKITRFICFTDRRKPIYRDTFTLQCKEFSFFIFIDAVLFRDSFLIFSFTKSILYLCTIWRKLWHQQGRSSPKIFDVISLFRNYLNILIILNEYNYNILYFDFCQSSRFWTN